MDILRKCRICKTDRDESFFYKNDKTNRCKACEQSRKRKERKTRDHYNSDRKIFLKKKYNITIEFYEELLNNQDGKCLICNGVGFIKKGSLCVDHCHISGKIRGLLCHSCNVGLGHYNDNINLLKNAIKYLEKHG